MEFIPRREKPNREFEEIIMEHIDSLYNTALRMTQNRSDAEDLVQDVCVRAYRFFHRFRKASNSKAWLLTILRNVYINEFRKRTKRPSMVSFDKIEPFSQSPEENRFLSSSNLQDVETLEELWDQTIRTAIDELPDELKMVVILFYVEECSYKEMANIVGCPVGTVMSRLYRARR